MRAPSEPDKRGSVDIEEFAHNVARMVEEGGEAMAAYLKPREEGRVDDDYSEVADVVKTLGQVAGVLAERPAARARAAIEPRQGLSRPVGECGQTHGGRAGRPGRRARPARQALRRSRMVDQPVLRFSQAGLSPDRAMGQPSGEGRPGARSAHPAEGRVLRAADRQRDRAVEFRADQSGAHARDGRLERRESRARHAHAGRGHRGRTRQSQDPPIRCQEIRGRPQSRAHARQGDFRERADAAHPVHAIDARPCSSGRC